MASERDTTFDETGIALAGLTALFTISAGWWALALWPVADAPQWLARTRFVCFGATGAGLPDAAGWIGLIGGPAGMLGILIAGWHRGVRALFRRSRSSAGLRFALRALGLGTLAMLLGAGHLVGWSLAQERRAARGEPLPPSTYPRLDREAPPLRLLAHDGVDRSLDDFAGRTVLLTFAYAHCTTVCPLVVRDALDAQARRAADGAEPPVVLIVTLDPWRDTPSRLPDMARDWKLTPGSAWILGGKVDTVEAVLDAWNVPRTRDPRTGEVVHPSLVYVIGIDGRIAFAASAGTEVLAELAHRAN